MLEYQIGISPHLSAEHNGAENRIGVFLLSCVPLRYALPGPFSALSSSLVLRPLGGWFFLPRPSSPGGVSKGEGPQSRPFVPRGGMGDGWRPPCFGWGSKGEGALRPLRHRPLPLALSWECPLAGAGNYAKARGIAARFLVIRIIRNHDGCPSKFQALRKGK